MHALIDFMLSVTVLVAVTWATLGVVLSPVALICMWLGLLIAPFWLLVLVQFLNGVRD